jgi:PKD repeat protein
VTVTDSNSYATTATSQLVFVVDSAVSVAAPSASTASVDAGQDVTFTAAPSGGTGSYAYVWSSLPTGCAGNTISISCEPTTPGTFSVSVAVTDTNGGTATSSTLSFTVDSDLSAGAPTADHASVDVGQTVLFNVTTLGGSGSLVYAWTGLPTGCSASSVASISCMPTGAGTFSVSVTVVDSNGYHVSPGALSFTVDPTPSVSAPTPSLASADVGQSVTFSVITTPGTGAFTYVWTGLPEGCTGVSAQVTCIPSAAGATTISVTVTDSNHVSATSTSIAFTVYGDPTVGLTANRTAFDLGQPVTLTASASSGSGGDTYSWSGLPAGCSGTAASLPCTPSAAATYAVTVKVTDSNGVSVTSSSVILVVSPPLGSSFTLTPASPVSGDNVTFTATVSGGTAPLTFTWVFGDGAKATGQSVSHTFGSSGTYTVTLFVNDSSGVSVVKTVSLKVAAAPALIAGLPATEFWFLLVILLVVLVAVGLVLVLRRRAPPAKPVEEYREPPKPGNPGGAKPAALEDQVKELEDMSKSG